MRWRAGTGRDTEHFLQRMHGSNFYSFAASMEMGLNPGPATKAGLHGVYTYDTSSATYAISSSGYKVYSSFNESSYFWGAQYEIAFDKQKTHTLGKRMAGAGQIAARPGAFHMMAIWLHCLHLDGMGAWAQQGLHLGVDFFDENALYGIWH